MSRPEAPPGASEAARLLARATDDPALRSRLRSHYEGRHDVLDALWWRVHPLTTAPSGRADPALALDPLRRAAYSRSTAAPVPYRDAGGATVLISPGELALREALTVLDADTAALDRVLADDVGERRPPVLPPDPNTATADPNSPMPIDGMRRPLVRRVVLAVAAVVVIAALGFTLGRLADRPGPGAGSDSSASPYDGGAQRGEATLALLESAQQPRDIPPFALGTDTIASSVHLIFNGYGPGVLVYGALGHRDSVCLVVVIAEERSSQTCSTTDRFIDDGLRLRVTTTGRVVNDSGYPVPSFYRFRWAGDGSISATSNAVPYPALPSK